jgi:hypothetical protein
MHLDLEQLDEQGFTIVPGFLATDLTTRIRAHIDSLLPPVGQPHDEERKRWHSVLRHPIPGDIMVELLDNPDLIDLAHQLLEPRELRLLEQVLIRSDPSPAPHEPLGWHVDWAFHPRHYQARPRQTYFHMVHCLNTVPAGGAAFLIVPGSHHQTYAATAELSTDEDLTAFKQDPARRAGVDLSDGIEVCPREGDLLVFNPMALHSGSKNRTDQPRYVHFASFFDTSAQYLRDELRRTKYRDGFPDSLKQSLPADLVPLLGW